ncbi:MAG: RimK/LysX family protein [Porticoccaceae bacterium]|nr:RimK/LysX family protein [Porticoccaceae bacterium]
MAKNALNIAWLLLACLFMTACQTPPPPAEPAPAATDVVETAIPAPSAVVAVEEPPLEPPVLQCPEPEPAPACPPAPKPKPCPVCPESRLDGKMLVGEVEKVRFDPPGVTYTARIDSGATGNSIHATNIVRFERDGEKWVRFELDSVADKPIVMERQVVRRVKVRQVETNEFDRRLVVMMTMTLGSITEQIELSLNDRSDMEYSVLIGRNFLRNNAIVDVSQEFIAK